MKHVNNNDGTITRWSKDRDTWHSSGSPKPIQSNVADPETPVSIREWAEHTFGPITSERIVKRALEEFDELIDTAETYDEIVEEAADVIICLYRFPNIQEVINRKMKKNRARKWVCKGDGTGYHIKET